MYSFMRRCNLAKFVESQQMISYQFLSQMKNEPVGSDLTSKPKNDINVLFD